MKISAKSQYGLRAMAYLMKNPKKVCSLKLISKEEGISFDYLEKIFSKLEKAGLVESKKGSQGGYLLAMAPKKIKLGQIINALEDRTILAKCVSEDENCSCVNQSICTTRIFWQHMQNSFDSLINSKTLSDLVDRKTA